MPDNNGDKPARAAEIERKLKKADQSDNDTAKLLATLELLNSTIADTNARLDAMEERERERPIPKGDNAGGTDTMSDPDRRLAEMTEAQLKADSVAMMWGATAPRPMDGESVIAYRKRLLTPYMRHSKEFKDLDLRKVGPETLPGIEAAVYADAAKASRHPTVPEGTLMERRRPDGKGHVITEFWGSPHVWMDRFGGSRRFVTKIDTRAGVWNDHK